MSTTLTQSISSTPKKVLHWFMATFALSLSYLAAVFLSQLQQHNNDTSLLWLPSGVAFAFLHHYGLRLWPALFIAAALLSLQTLEPLLSVELVLADLLSATVAILLLRYYQFCHSFSRIHDVIRFIAIAVIIAPIFSASLHSFLLYDQQNLTLLPIGKFWALNWLSNSLGMLIMGAFLLSWRNFNNDLYKPQSLLELLLLLISLALIVQLSLSQQEGLSVTLLLLPVIPLIVLTALRTAQQGVTLALVIISLMLLAAGNLYLPDFHQYDDARLLMISSALLWIAAITGLTVAAAHREHHIGERLSYLASHDALTKLVNSNEFENRLQRAIDSAKNQNISHTLLSLDLDRLKQINDNCGHAAGDELLRQVTEEFKNRVRTRDTVARLGGDEFAILLEHCSQQQGYEVGHSICESLEKFHFHCKKRHFSIGASIGLVTIDNNANNVHELLMQADDACYVAKTMGGNRVQIYDDSGQKSDWQNNTASWASALSAGLQDHQLCLYFQPIHALRRSSAARGQQKERILELLVRGNNNGEILLPSAFLPTAERNKLMADLDRWVIKQSLRWISTHAAEAKTVTLFTLNLSLQSLKDENMLRFITSRLQQYEVDAKRICFEINEEVLNSNQAKTNRFIRELKQHGCQFTLDRFHNSASSLANLRDHPFDFVKLDPRLTKHISENTPDRIILKALLEVAQMLNLKVIASHIDDEEIYQQLTELGVEYIQGFYLSRPQALERPTKKP
ncbi:MAG: EAL domain-containing protein [Gammaproteobacteria bacterium]|nr:EAL domain-containing protein [Gammaproteobacteria bacterium]